jgi:hypothetical protein
MMFLVITAFYDKGDRYRRRNLTATLANNLKVFPEAIFCVAEQNPTGWFETLNMDSERVKHVGVNIEGGFCKTALLNAAIESVPDADVITMVDGDVFLDAKIVDYIRKHWNDGSLVFPFSEAVYLKETDARLLVGGKALLPGQKDHGVNIERQTGLCNVFTRHTWHRIGKYDEEFVNWGAEDDAFLTKCRRIVSPIHRNTEPGYIAYHLFHPIINTEKYLKNSPLYLANRVRQACIRRMSDDDLKQYVLGKVTLCELVNKYSKMGRLEVSLDWQCTPRGFLHMDTTIYDVDRTGEMSFTKVMKAIEAEDSINYCVSFIDDILLRLADLSPAQLEEIMALRKYYEELANAVQS